MQGSLCINGIINSSTIFMAYILPVWHIISLFSWYIVYFNIYEFRSLVSFSFAFSSTVVIFRKLFPFQRSDSYLFLYGSIMDSFLSFNAIAHLNILWDFVSYKNLNCFFSKEVGNLPNCLTNNPTSVYDFSMLPSYLIIFWQQKQ